MKKYTLSLCLSLGFFLLTSQIEALPRFALLRGDANCMGCHINPTGGQLRGPGGIAFEINDLPMWRRGDSIKYTGQIAPGVRLGGDFRSQVLYFAQKGPFGQGRTDTTQSILAFHAMSLAFELDVQATNTLHGFMRYDPLGIIPSEGWAMLHFVHSSGEIFQSGNVVTNAYVKVGSFLPAFGIRFDDHTAYVKGGNASLSTGRDGFPSDGFFWTPGYRDIGAEIGALFFDHLGIVAGIFNGSEISPGITFNPTNNKALCFRANYAGEIIEDMLAGEIGVSSYMHSNDENVANANLSLSGVHASLRVGPVTILNEYDFGINIPVGGVTMSKAHALCSESAVHIGKGLDLLFRYETFKDDSSEVKSRIMIGAQWFPLRFLEIRPEFRIASVTAPDPTKHIMNALTETTMLVQTHVFF